MSKKVETSILGTFKLVLCLTMVFSSLTIPNFSKSLYVNTNALTNLDIWTYYDSDMGFYPYVDFSPFTNSEPDDFLFNVFTPQQLAAVAVLVNHPDKTAVLKDSNSNSMYPTNFEGKIIILQDDIDLSEHLWEPIGFDNKTIFKGGFDGNKKAIKNMFIGRADDSSLTYKYTGLFGNVNGDICATRIYNSKIYARETSMQNFYAGTVIAYICGDIYKCYTDENCYLYYITCSGGFLDRVGGIAGYISNGNILSCENNAKLCGFFNDESSVSEVYIGGIVGSVSFSDIQGCINNADIHDLQDSKFIGGIAGETYCDCEISHCVNRGNLLINKIYKSNSSSIIDSKAGGIVACVDGFNFHKINISHCTNTGLIWASKGKYNDEKNIDNTTKLNIGAVAGCYDNVVKLEINNCETQDKMIIPVIGNYPDCYYYLVYKK